jgi:16S rRNA G527 N7-methylase RsmG
MAMKLFRPALDVVLIERNYRKSLFLKELGRHLSLEVTVHSGSAESFPQWEEINLATIRALRPTAEILSTLAILRIPLLAFQGRAPAYYPGWAESKRVRFPLSRNRSAVLLEHQGFT